MVGYHHEAINGRELTTTEHSEAGLASGIATRLIIQPLDVLKIRFQLQEEPIRGKMTGKYKGVLQSTRLIFKEEGYGALWKGHVPAQGLSAMYGLVQFSSFETFSLAVGDRLPSSSSDFLCGMLAGCFAMTCAMPLDVIRTRLVAQGNQGVVYRGTLHAVKHIWKREGVAGYFRGWVPSIIQIAPFTGLQFTFYNMFMELWRKVVPEHETTGVLFSGAAAGTVAKTILYPLDMVRHRLQMNGFERKGFGKASRYQNGMMKAMAHVVKHESAYGFIISSYSFVFTLSKLSFGIASDSYSSVTIYTFGLFIASLASIFLAYAQSIYEILFVMVAIGAIQGAAWVPATKLVSKWYEGSSFGIIFSILGCGSTTAGILVTRLDDYYWRTTAFYLGSFSVIFCGLILLFLRADNSHPQKRKIKENSSSPLYQIISSNVIWGIAFSYLFTLEARTVGETWLPLFVEEQKLSSAKFLTISETAGMLGTVSSGIVLDRISLYIPIDNARRLLATFSSVAMLFSFMLSTSFPSYYLLFAFLCGFFTNASLNLWSLIMAVAGEKHIAGSASAFMSFIANFGPVLFAGSPLAHLISNYGYSVFVPFFSTQIIIFLTVTLMRIPLRMSSTSKEE